MKNLSKTLSVCSLAAVLLASSGCVQDQTRRVRSAHYVPRSPDVDSKQWITWVDQKVDTRYANGQRPEPGSEEWGAIVDYIVFSDRDRGCYRTVQRRTTSRRNYASDYCGPARFSTRDGSYRGVYSVCSLQWRQAVTTEILSGRVPAPPPRSDPWDTPLAPNSDR